MGVIERGALKPNESIAKDLSPAHAHDSECSPMIERMISSHTYKAIPEAEPTKERAQGASSSHTGPWFKNAETVPAVCQESNVQHALHKRVLSPPIASCALNNDTAVPIQNSSRRNIHPDNNNLECWSNPGHVLPYKHDSIGEECLSAKLTAPSNTNAPPIGDLTTTDIPQEKNPLKQKKNMDTGDRNEAAQIPKKKATAGNKRKCGASGDPRMNRAVQAKLDNPNLSLVTALMKGGFVFNDMANSPEVSLSDVRDTDNITVYQRRNQLLRRLRKIKEKASKTDINKGDE